MNFMITLTKGAFLIVYKKTNMETIKTNTLTTFQLKAARRALGISLKQAAKETGIAESAITRLESCDLSLFPQRSSLPTVFRLRQFLEQKGIVFLNDNMVQYCPVTVDPIQIRIILPNKPNNK